MNARRLFLDSSKTGTHSLRPFKKGKIYDDEGKVIPVRVAALCTLCFTFPPDEDYRFEFVQPVGGA